MADKILTSDELAQKFLDNVQTHIGISSTLKDSVTLDKIKNAIINGWGFDLSVPNKCVCVDKSYMSTNGNWGTHSYSNDMQIFWRNAYGNNSIVSITNPSDNSVHQQIKDLDAYNDMQLLSENHVEVKGCCVSLGSALKDKVTVSHSGVTSATTVTAQFIPRIVGHEGNVAPSLMIAVKNNSIITFTSPTINYFDVNPDDTSLKWLIKIILSYPSGTTLNQTTASALNINSTTYTSLSISGTTGATSTTFYKTITGNSLNDMLGMTKFGFYTPMAYTEPIPDIEIDVSNCYVETSTDSHLKINTATYVNNMETMCYFVNFPGDGPFDNVAITMTGSIVSSDQQLKIKISQNEASRFDASTSYWMWVGMRASLTTSQVFVRYCFEVNVQRLSDRCNISLVSTECYIDLSSTNQNILDYTTNMNANYTVKNIESASNQYTSLSTTGTKTLGYRLGGFVMNKISVYKNSGDSSGVVRYKVNNGYSNLGSIPNNDQGSVNLIHGDYFSTINQVHTAMYSDTLSYDFY